MVAPYCYQSCPLIPNDHFHNNHTGARSQYPWDPGVITALNTDAVIRNTTIENNSGGGIKLDRPRVLNGIISGIEAGSWAGGITLLYGTTRSRAMRSRTILQISPRYYGADALIENNIITATMNQLPHQTDRGGSAIGSWSSRQQFGKHDKWKRRPGRHSSEHALVVAHIQSE